MQAYDWFSQHWIYNWSDFQRLFDLSMEDLSGPTLVLPGRISSINAELTQQGCDVVSLDELYVLSEAELIATVEQIYERSVSYLQNHPEV